MEMESGGEAMAFQEQPITGDGPDQESAVGCVTEGKKEFCSLRKYNSEPFRTRTFFQSVKFAVRYKCKGKRHPKNGRRHIATVLSELSSKSNNFFA